MRPTLTRQPHILVASDHTEAALELQQLAERRGLAVRRAYTGVQALQQAFDPASGLGPDLIVLHESLPGIDPLDASRALRDDPRLGSGVPILLVTTGKPTSAQHHAALRAGIWEYVAYPFHTEELGGKLDGYLLRRFEAARARDQAGSTAQTGLYTPTGLRLRAQELTLQAFHHAASLACVALAPVTQETPDGGHARAVDPMARGLRDLGGRSDAVRALGRGEVAVAAPGTDRADAVLFAERGAPARQSAAP